MSSLLEELRRCAGRCHTEAVDADDFLFVARIVDQRLGLTAPAEVRTRAIPVTEGRKHLVCAIFVSFSMPQPIARHRPRSGPEPASRDSTPTGGKGDLPVGVWWPSWTGSQTPTCGFLLIPRRILASGFILRDPGAAEDPWRRTTLKFARAGSPRLTLVSIAALVFLIVSGLVITLAPFHAAVEWTVLLHTVAGLLALLPLVWYTLSHWRDYKSYNLSDTLLLGYVAAVSLLVCLVSGLVVTWQGLFGVLMSPVWRNIHLYSTLAALGDRPGPWASGLLSRSDEGDSTLRPATRLALGDGHRGRSGARRWAGLALLRSVLCQRASRGLQLPLRRGPAFRPQPGDDRDGWWLRRRVPRGLQYLRHRRLSQPDPGGVDGQRSPLLGHGPPLPEGGRA